MMKGQRMNTNRGQWSRLGAVVLRRLGGVVGGLGLLALVGCSLVDPASESAEVSAPPAIPLWEPAEWRSSATPLMVQVCVDVSDGYPAEYREHALGLVADGVEALAAPGGGAGTVFVAMMSANSFPDSNLIGVFELRPVAPAEEPPATLTVPPTATSGLIDPQGKREAERLATAEALAVDAANAANATAFAAAQSTHQAVAGAELARAREFGEMLRAFRPALSVAARATLDALGCISRAAERMAEHEGRKLLIIASDLDGTGEQQVSPNLDLSGVRVRVIDLPSDNAGQADGWYFRTQHWLRQFGNAGTQDVEFYDPAASQLLTLADLLPPDVGLQVTGEGR